MSHGVTPRLSSAVGSGLGCIFPKARRKRFSKPIPEHRVALTEHGKDADPMMSARESRNRALDR
jgi:hypothetical protein